MIGVVVEWNTDSDNKWVDEVDRPVMHDDSSLTYPLSVYGPFATMEDAMTWMTDALPDNMDVLDMYSLNHDFPKSWPIANPSDYPDGYYRPGGQTDALLSIVHEAPMPFLRAV